MKESVKKRKASEQEVKSALIKKALGYDATEIVEEYALDGEGDIKLTKKKVTKKNVPPDITALKILIEGESKSVSELTDQELEREKQRLLSILQAENKNKGVKN